MTTPLDPGTLVGHAGVGVDVVGISAFADQLDEPGTRFAQAFTPGERRAARSGESTEAQSLAARWAAKEAVIKAWSSTCFGHPEVIDPEYRRPAARSRSAPTRGAGLRSGCTAPSPGP